MSAGVKGGQHAHKKLQKFCVGCLDKHAASEMAKIVLLYNQLGNAAHKTDHISVKRRFAVLCVKNPVPDLGSKLRIFKHLFKAVQCACLAYRFLKRLNGQQD